jgi:hypothetical protein
LGSVRTGFACIVIIFEVARILIEAVGKLTAVSGLTVVLPALSVRNPVGEAELGIIRAEVERETRISKIGYLISRRSLLTGFKSE